MSKIAFIYPGQASQFVGMGKDLYDQIPIAKEMYQTANDILRYDISKISFEGPEDELKQTRVTQPAIFILSVIINKILEERNFKPELVAGHSLGEYSALVSAGAIAFEDGLQLVKKRAELMQQADKQNPGSMAAIIGLSQEEVVEVCESASSAGIVQPANFNSIQQIVISGSIEGVEAAMELATEKGAMKAVQLEVSGAFHSPLMKQAQDSLKKELDKIQFNKTQIPVYANVSANAVTEPDDIKELLCQQITAPVRWTELIQNMIADGASLFYEVGPGKVLTGLLKRIDKKTKCVPVGALDQLNSIE